MKFNDSDQANGVAIDKKISLLSTIANVLNMASHISVFLLNSP
jgi:hypothetical protein